LSRSCFATFRADAPDTSIQVLLNKAYTKTKHGMEWIVDDFIKRIDGGEMQKGNAANPKSFVRHWLPLLPKYEPRSRTKMFVRARLYKRFETKAPVPFGE
jgi:hypothetical protein